MNIPPILIRILGDLIPKEQRAAFVANVETAAYRAEETASMVSIIHERIQDMQIEIQRLQALLSPVTESADLPEPEPTITIESPEQVIVTEPEIEESHPKSETTETEAE